MPTTPRDGRSLIANARSVLRKPLCFGDPKQVAARQFLEAVEKYREHLVTCDTCRERQFCPYGDLTPQDVEEAALAMLADEWGPHA